MQVDVAASVEAAARGNGSLRNAGNTTRRTMSRATVACTASAAGRPVAVVVQGGQLFSMSQTDPSASTIQSVPMNSKK